MPETGRLALVRFEGLQPQRPDKRPCHGLLCSSDTKMTQSNSMQNGLVKFPLEGPNEATNGPEKGHSRASALWQAVTAHLPPWAGEG